VKKEKFKHSRKTASSDEKQKYMLTRHAGHEKTNLAWLAKSTTDSNLLVNKSLQKQQQKTD